MSLNKSIPWGKITEEYCIGLNVGLNVLQYVP